jgi:hypothetical protein
MTGRITGTLPGNFRRDAPGGYAATGPRADEPGESESPMADVCAITRPGRPMAVRTLGQFRRKVDRRSLPPFGPMKSAVVTRLGEADQELDLGRSAAGGAQGRNLSGSDSGPRVPYGNHHWLHSTVALSKSADPGGSGIPMS